MQDPFDRLFELPQAKDLPRGHFYLSKTQQNVKILPSFLLLLTVSLLLLIFSPTLIHAKTFSNSFPVDRGGFNTISVSFTDEFPVTLTIILTMPDFSNPPSRPSVHTCFLTSPDSQATSIPAQRATSTGSPAFGNGVSFPGIKTDIIFDTPIVPSPGSHTITCRYRTQFINMPSQYSFNANGVTGTPAIFANNMSNEAGDANSSAVLFPTSAQYTNSAQSALSVCVSNLHFWTIATKAELLRFQIGLASYAVPPGTATTHLTDGRTEQITVSSSDDYIKINSPLPSNTIGICFSLTTPSPLSSFPFSVAIFETSATTPLFVMGTTVLIPTPYGAYSSPALYLDTVIATLPQDNQYVIGNQVVPHAEYKFTFSVALPSSDYSMRIIPPAILRLYMFFLGCSSSNISGLIVTKSLDNTPIIISTVNTSLVTGKITCTAIFSPFTLPKSTSTFDYDYLTFSAMVMNKNNFHSGPVVPWPINRIPASPPIPSNPSPIISYLPQQYGLIDSNGIAKWTVVVDLPGAFLDELPLMTVDVDTTVINPLFALTSQTHSSRFYSWTTSNGPLGTMDSISTLTSLIARNSHQTLVSFVSTESMPTQSAIMVDPKLCFSFSLTPSHYPTTTNNQYQLVPPSSTTLPALKINLAYGERSMDLTIPHFNVAHFPAPTITNPPPSDPSSLTILPGLPFTTTIRVYLGKTPLGFPEGDLSEYPDNSVWRTSPSTVTIYPGTSFAINLSTSGAPEPELVDNSRPKDWLLNAGSQSNENSILAGFLYSANADAIEIEDDLYFFSITVTVPPENRSTIFSIEASVSMTMSAQMGYVPFGEKSVFSYTQDLSVAQLGVETIIIKVPDDMNSQFQISRLADLKRPLNKQIISTIHGTTIDRSFVGINGGLLNNKVELWYKNDNNVDVFVKLITTNPTITAMPFITIRTYHDAFFRITYNLSGSSEIYSLDTHYFDIIPACLRASLSTVGEIESRCTNGQICASSTGQCETKPEITPIDIPISQKCPQCDENNTQSCTTSTPSTPSVCTCKDDWNGLTCKQSKLCDPKKSKCNPDNGYTLPVPNTTQCESTCNCFNQWAGLSCQTCQLQCFNDGLRYKDCARCGCQEGYSGSQCECSALTGKIIIKATNDLIISSLGQLSNSASSSSTATASTLQLFEIDTTHIGESFKMPVGSTDDDLQLYFLFKALFISFQNDLTNQANGKFTLSITPTSTSPTTSTQFNFLIRYNCASYNPHISSKEQLSGLWDKFVSGFVQNEQVQMFFTFPTEGGDVESELTPTPPQLPGDDEVLINGVTGFNGLFIIFMTLFIIYWF